MERHKYSGFLGNGCKQNRAQLINYTLSGKKCNCYRYFCEDNQFPSEVHS